MRTLLFLAATVRSFAHMPLGISDRNTTILAYKSTVYPVYISLSKKNMHLKPLQ